MKKESLVGDLFLVVCGIGIGVLCVFGIQSRIENRDSKIQATAPRYVASDNAIARFGLAPVNPDWVQVTHKTGQPIDGVPSHEWAVFTFLYEPKVERLEQNGAAIWKVTFEP